MEKFRVVEYRATGFCFEKYTDSIMEAVTLRNRHAADQIKKGLNSLAKIEILDGTSYREMPLSLVVSMVNPPAAKTEGECLFSLGAETIPPTTQQQIQRAMTGEFMPLMLRAAGDVEGLQLDSIRFGLNSVQLGEEGALGGMPLDNLEVSVITASLDAKIRAQPPIKQGVVISAKVTNTSHRSKTVALILGGVWRGMERSTQ